MGDPRNSASFGKESRLAASAQFEGLLREGVRRRIGGFAFYVSVRPAGVPRLGILISRKHSKRATIRNRFKRCIREAFRLEQGRLGSVDLLIRPPYGVEPTKALFVRLRTYLSELGR